MTAAPAATTAAAPLAGAPRPRGALADRGFRWLASLGGFLVLAILALIAVSTGRLAWPAFRHEGLGFVTSDRWDVARGHFGALAFVFGTLLVSTIALAFAVPVSIGIALFVTEVAPRFLRRAVIVLLDLLAAIPSVVYGLWAILVLAPALTGLYERVASAVSGVPVLADVLTGAPVTGRSFMTAGLILAIMITPIVASLTREVFATVPREQKEAALALGATRWEMIRGAVIPHSRSGLAAAVLIGLGRAMGETIAVALVIGSSPQITSKLFGSGDTMAAVIANQFGDATGTYRAALVGLGVLLFGLSIAVGVIARAIVVRYERRLSGAAA